MVKLANKSIQLDVSNWLIISCFLIIFAIIGSASSMAGPWADRAIARRVARVERTELRDRQRRAETPNDVRASSGEMPVIITENVLRPGVIRRFARRGISAEELEARTRGGHPQQLANGQSAAHSINQYGYQAKPRLDAGLQSVLDSKKTELPSGLRTGVITSGSGGPQQALGRVPTESRSVLVGAEEPLSSSIEEGPRFPGMEGKQTKTRDTPVVTHEPIELLPTPKPSQ
jgi:hypothetical protein